MIVKDFHDKLLGVKHFQISPDLEKFYQAFGHIRGFDDATLNEERFRGVFVAGMGLTEVVYPVYVIIPKGHMKWALDQMETLSRHMFSVRKKSPSGIKVVRDALRQLRISHRITKDEVEPDRWVSFGFSSSDYLLPKWMEGRLLG